MPAITTDLPLSDAVSMITGKSPVGSAMTSREWAGLKAEIRFRSMFSATVENERLLAEMQLRLQARIDLAKKDGRTMDRGVFIEEMRDELAKAGYKRGEAKRDSLKDLKSTRRLGLIFDMNVAQAQGYARWKADMTPEGLENEPCYELIRVMNRMEARDWPRIWDQAGGEFFDGPGSNDDYPRAQGRMIAAKNDPVWTLISRFGTPWPPFDWGSGMGLRGIDREEAEALGVIDPADVVLPLDTPFNRELEASLLGIAPARRSAIAESMAGDVSIDGDRLRAVAPETSVTLPAVPAGLAAPAARARRAVAAMSEEQLAAAMTPIRETVAHQRLAAAATETLTDRETVGRALLQFFALGAGLSGLIRTLRGEPGRDAYWGELDFSGVSDYFAELLGGAA